MSVEQTGVVVIGRNEGERLKLCLRSVQGQAGKVVYVDSGSSDGSVAHAESCGVEVVRLDMSMPFSAGRARNEGFACLLAKWPELVFVQFVDGDCEMVDGWLLFAQKHLTDNSQWAIVAGRRIERFPEQTVYNLLCDIEWNTPVGEAEVCGGDFMARAAAFGEVGGFNPVVIAGEEPELCYRLCRKGWRIYRLDHLMTRHDAAITRFSQWWKRSVRSGHAYAQGYVLHGVEGEGYCLRDSLRIWLWSIVVPAGILLPAVAVDQRYALLFMIYPVQFVRIARSVHNGVGNWRYALVYALFNLVGKWPQLVGQLLFLKRTLAGKRYSIIEYN